MISRRSVLTLLGGAAATWPVGAKAQERVRRVGLLYSTSPQLTSDVFLQSLRENGFVEGQNVVIEARSARGDYERLPTLAAELAELRVAIIGAFGIPAVRAAKTASLSSVPAIPVVFAMAGDPVAEGFVESYNRPGRNMTGVTSISGALEPKRVDLMREFLRDDAAIAILINPASPLSGPQRSDAEGASRVLGQRLEVLTARDQAEIEKAFAALRQLKVSVLVIASDNFFFSQMQRMASLAAQAAVPVIGPLRRFAEEGGLLSYGASIPEVNRHAGVMASKILKGVLPAELPVQQPTKFELVINLRTARALGITVPPTLLARADEVIE